MDMTISPVNTTSGDEIGLGRHMMRYSAMDMVKNASIECNVSLVVIDGSLYSSSYEYCLREKFHIYLRFNTSYHELAADEEEMLKSGIDIKPKYTKLHTKKKDVKRGILARAEEKMKQQ